ncbi:MAG: DUF2834 domain-containing protein, partial [Myxococcota bacterium]
MNAKIIALGVVLVGFCIFTAEALAEMGLSGFFMAHEANMATRQVFVDLVIGLTILLGFVWRDAQERGLPRLPYLVATLLLGSIGPLAYLL